MAGIFVDYFRVIKPAPSKNNYVTANGPGEAYYNNFSWYTRVMAGATSRYAQYQQFRNMDGDVFVSRALDTIAEEMTPMDEASQLPFEVVYQNDPGTEVPERTVSTVRAALRHWCDLQSLWDLRFDIARTVIKYGDCFFRKTSDFKKWLYIDPFDVIGVIVDDEGKIKQYHVKRARSKFNKNLQGPNANEIEIIPAEGMIHFSTYSGVGETGPFGESVLAPTIRAFRHLSLLKDSVIIYRIVRAPERRVFFVDVGNMPPQRVKAYLESVKNEVRQKRMPNEFGGTEKVDSVYNPMSMIEDYFFPQPANGRGSRVETLSGGENLGEISDLLYFQNEFLQGLRIPSSYMRGSAQNGAVIQDGKVGVAYIEEMRFANYVRRLQLKIEPEFDAEFKKYLKSASINVDPNLFRIVLPEPQNFLLYKQAAIDAELSSTFNNLKESGFIARRMLLTRYLGWSQDQIQANEELLKQEMGIPDEGLVPNKLTDLRMMYDPNWAENKPKIQVSDKVDNYVEQTTPKLLGEPQQIDGANLEKPSDEEPGGAAADVGDVSDVTGAGAEEPDVGDVSDVAGTAPAEAPPETPAADVGNVSDLTAPETPPAGAPAA